MDTVWTLVGAVGGIAVGLGIAFVVFKSLDKAGWWK